MVRTGREALARGHTGHGHDSHRNSGTIGRQGRGLDGARQRRTTTCSSGNRPTKNASTRKRCEDAQPPFLRLSGWYPETPYNRPVQYTTPSRVSISRPVTSPERAAFGTRSSLSGTRPKASVRDRDGHLAIAKFPNRGDEVNTLPALASPCRNLDPGATRLAPNRISTAALLSNSTSPPRATTFEYTDHPMP